MSDKSDKTPFPFSDLLDALTEAGFLIDTAQRIDFYTLISRYDGCSPEELARATAALFAANPAEYKKIVSIFFRIYPRESAPSKTAPALKQNPKTSAGWKRITLIGLSSILIVFAAYVAWLIVPAFQRSPYPVTGASTIHLPPTPPPQGASQPLESWIPAPASCAGPASIPSYWLFPVAVTVAAFLIAFGFVGFISGRANTKRAQTKTLSRALVSLGGPRHYRIDIPFQPLSAEQLDDMIALLEEALASIEHLRELDIDRTVFDTVHAGLVPTLRHRARHGALRALLLIDIGDVTRPYRAKIKAFEDRLQKRGLDLERLYFDRNPARVSTKPGGRLVPLESMAIKLGGIPMILLSTGHGLPGPGEENEAADLRVFEAWPNRLLLNPLEQPGAWPAGLERNLLRIAAYPMNRSGLLAARQALREQRARLRAPKKYKGLSKKTNELNLEHKDTLLSMLAMAPVPSFELAWALRERFLPDTPDEVVLGMRPFLEYLSQSEQMDAQFHQHAIQEALQRFRAGDRDKQLEKAARAFYRELLDKNEPADKESAAFLRWQRDRALQGLHSGEGGEIERALQTLKTLAQGPLSVELGKHLAFQSKHEGGLHGEDAAALLRAMQSVKGSVPALPIRSLWAWSWPSLKTIGFLVVGFGLAGGIAGALGFYTSRPLPLLGILIGQRELKAALCLETGGVHDVLSDGKYTFILGSKTNELNPEDPDALGLNVLRLQSYRFVHQIKTAAPLTLAGWRKPLSSVSHAILNLEEARESAPPEQNQEQNQVTLYLAVTLASQRNSPILFGVSLLIDRETLSPLQTWNTSIGLSTSAEFQWRHSAGILPGTGDEIWSRIADPSAPRSEEPIKEAPKAPPEPPQPDCPIGQTKCNNDCVDTKIDQNNCGECGKSCGKEACVNGECEAPKELLQCPKEMIPCGTLCVDPRSNNSHCGGCGRPCGPGTLCIAGKCASCPGGTTQCGVTCANLSSDPNNCGECGKRCIKGQSCRAGACFSAGNCMQICESKKKQCYTDCFVSTKQSPFCTDDCDLAAAACENTCQPSDGKKPTSGGAGAKPPTPRPPKPPN